MVTEYVLFVEGISDKKKIEMLVTKDVQIICTNGTVRQEKLDQWGQEYEYSRIYLLFDADDAGAMTRKKFLKEFPDAVNLYVNRMYREVANTPPAQLREVLLKADIPVVVVHGEGKKGGFS
jgi:toprim domain protein